jgi:membrane protease YdiL (CAAX protease family)
MSEPVLQEIPKNPPKEWRFTILHAFGLCILFAVIQAAIFLAIRQTTGLKLEELRWFHLAVINGIPGAIVVAVGAYLNGFSVHDMLLQHLPDAGDILSTVVAVLGIIILSSELNNILLRYLPFTMDDQAQMIQRLFNEDLIGVIITVGVIAPLVEELLFRGVILDGLRMHYRISTAVVVSSVLFGLIHLNPIVSIGTFLLALFLAWLRLSTRSLMLCVISHSVFNITPFILQSFNTNVQGFTSIPTNAVQFQPIWLDVIGLLLLIAGITGLKFSSDEENHQRLPLESEQG